MAGEFQGAPGVAGGDGDPAALPQAMALALPV